MRFLYTLSTTAKIKGMKISNAHKDAEKLEPSHIGGVM